ncbi:CENP-B like protein 2 [Dictyocoela muelleri]|nr:CENP-B like protein 2 [Dictyocoela muelleri]
MIKENRKIPLLLDNFSGHKVGDKKNIKLLFFPPNSTSIIQPLDAGIIHSFKSKLKKLLNNFKIYNALVNDLDHDSIIKKINMLNIVHWIKKEFDEISVEIIFNCWSKTNVFTREKKIDVSTEIIEEDESSSNNRQILLKRS